MIEQEDRITKLEQRVAELERQVAHLSLYRIPVSPNPSQEHSVHLPSVKSRRIEGDPWVPEVQG